MYYALAPAAPMNPTGSRMSTPLLKVRDKRTQPMRKTSMENALGATDVGSKAAASDRAVREKLLRTIAQ